jgi:hypothetical protein
LNLLVVLLIGACAPMATESPAEPAGTEPPAEQPATEPQGTEAQEFPVGTDKNFTEPVPVTLYEYGQGGEPDLCDPDNPILTPVGQLEIQRTESAILDGQIALFVDYVNQNGQSFRISVHSLDPAVATEYLETLAVCLEAVEVGPPSGIEATSAPFDQILLDATSEATGLSLEELQARRDEYVASSEAAGETPSLRGFLESLGADPDAVLQDALDRAAQAIEDARNAGLLTDEQADDYRARSQIEYEEEFADRTFSFLAEEILAFSGSFADEWCSTRLLSSSRTACTDIVVSCSQASTRCRLCSLITMVLHPARSTSRNRTHCNSVGAPSPALASIAR